MRRIRINTIQFAREENRKQLIRMPGFRMDVDARREKESKKVRGIMNKPYNDVQYT